MDIDQTSNRFVGLIPKLKTKLQLTGFLLSLTIGLLTHLWHPEAVVSQVFLVLIAVLFLFLPLAFNATGDLETENKSRYLAVLLIVSAVIIFALIAAGTFLAWYQMTLDDFSTYSVRIDVVDEHDQVVEESHIYSSVGSEPLKVAGGWEVRIPKQGIPANGEVEFRVTAAGSFLAGSGSLKLGTDHHPSLSIRITPDTSASLRGTVLAPSGAPISRIKVWIAGYPPAYTDAEGGFSLPAHAGEGQFVEFFVSSGHKTQAQNLMAGSKPVTIVFEGR